MHSPWIWIITAWTLSSSAWAETRNYDFNITWVTGNPDAAFPRPVVGVNGKWPVPRIEATVGDRIVVQIHNQLGNRSTSVHFHGIFQNGTNQMDGAAGATQCPLPPGRSMTYNFTIEQPGTYWWHSHTEGGYPDGLRGPLVITDPKSPFKDQYDEELVITLSDWYHEQVPTLLKSFISVSNPTGAEPVADAALMNDTQNATFPVKPGKTYMLRLINVAAFAPQYFWIENHTMSIVEVDGVYTQPADADMIYITPAQRYSVLVKTLNDTGANFPVVGAMDTDLFDTVPDSLNPNVTSWLSYDDSKPYPDAALVDDFDNVFDDFTLIPYDGMTLLDRVDHSITMDFNMGDLGNGANYAFINESTYVPPKVPTLYSALSTNASATNVDIYGSNTNAFVLAKGEVVEIILNSADPGKHPFHLHGHNFQAVARSDDDAGPFAYNVTYPTVPMRRDTFWVRPNGNIVLRFQADNPGVWLFHCHLEWHLNVGLAATMVEDPLSLQASGLAIPPDHLAACQAQGLPVSGNAAGNTRDLLDLTGANTAPAAPLPAGFTARGIVALVMSCVAAVVGLVVIVWYGMAEVRP